jgi:putative hydrolase of the HAD superfamily
MIRGVLFDLDGTLFDRVKSVAAFVESQHSRLHHLLSGISAREYAGRFVELDARGYVAKDLVYRQLATELSLGEEAAAELFADFVAQYHQHAVPFPELESTLAALRTSGLRLAIITNGGELHQRRTIAALRIAGYFDAVLISESEGIRKPEPAIYRRALSSLELDPSSAVYVGDHPEVDVRGAKAAGLFAIWKRDLYWGDCPEADGVIDDLAELHGLILTLGSAQRT